MKQHILPVKNMVCHRCTLAVEDILKQLHIDYEKVAIGEIYCHSIPGAEQMEALSTALANIGLELIDTRVGSLIEKIKLLVIRKARNEVPDAERKLNLSVYLSQNLYHEYTYLSSLFSSVEGRTIENYYIEQRIEKVKELLVYNEMTLSAIAFEMDYSSTAHLSNQFKQVTGLTPSHFKKLGAEKRKLIDKV